MTDGERDAMNAMLAEENRHLRDILDRLEAYIFTKDTAGRYTYANHKVCNLFGLPLEQIVGRTDSDFFDMKRTVDLLENDRLVLENDRLSSAEEQIAKADSGETRYYWSVKHPTHDREGRVNGLAGISTDITERRKLEHELLAVNERLGAILETLPDILFEIDSDGRILYCHMPHSETPLLEALLAPEGDAADSIEAILPPEGARACRTALEMAEIRGHSAGHQFCLDSSPEEASWFELSVCGTSRTSGERNTFIVMVRDISQHKHAQKQIADSEAGLQELLGVIREGMWHWHVPSGRVLHNRYWYTLFGATDGGIPDTVDAFAQRIHPDDQPAVWQRISDLLEGRTQEYASEHRIVCDDGRQMWVQDRGSIVERDMAGNPLRIMGSFTDITERKAAEAELEKYQQHLEELVEQRTAELAAAKAAAEAASVAKSSFLANMSHEIRTPLNAITGMAHLIRRGGVSPQQSAQLAKLEAAGRHLLEIINDILDLSKIEAGKFVLAETEFHVDSLIGNVISMLHDRARAKGLSLHADIAPLGTPLIGDPTRLQQVILNYAANAIKFTRQGEVALRVKVLGETPDDVQLRFEVEDSGIGIAPETLPRLFEAFEQGDNSVTRPYGGTGLGLAINRKLAEAMGGTVGASSVIGSGSTFWFTVRLRRADIASLSPGQPNYGKNAENTLSRLHRGRRILVVDDEPINGEIVRCLLDDVGLEAGIASDGLEALEQLQKTHYDLVLMDMQMPHLDGLETTRRLRRMPACRNLPVLALTANAFAEDRQRCLDAGMNDFITKPIEPDTLFGALVKWLAPNA